MDRLTFEGNFCDIAQCLEMRGGKHCPDGYCSQRRVWERLKWYEDSDQDGRLVTLPCNVGQDVWFCEFWNDEICPATIVGIELNKHTPQCMLWIRIEYTSSIIGTQRYCERSDMALGKTIFLTRNEAEAALAGRSNKDGMAY